jgi:hypothetical protein
VGTKTFTLPAGTVKDKAGNSSLIVTKSYSVIADTEDPGTEDTEEPGTVYPQKWATGDGTVGDPWANDCIQKAYDACPAGGTIYLRAGYYSLSTALQLAKKINIIGEGIDKTFIVTANVNGFEITADYCSLKDFTLNADAQTTNTEGIWGIRVIDADYITMENIEVENGGYYGISLVGNYCTYKNIYSHDNYRHGLHPGQNGTGTNLYNTYQNIYAWDNGVDGFSDNGTGIDPVEETNNVYDNIHCWDNGDVGINIGYQNGGVLSNSFASGNGGEGMVLSYFNNFNINNCLSNLNDGNGIQLDIGENVNLTNVIVKNNLDDGILLIDDNNIVFTSCQFYDDRETPLQSAGINIATGNTGISFLNCKVLPNADAGIYNPNGVVVTVITEKMLAKF